ncbi:formin-like protein 5 [Cyclospora cayetanensis]|uniref:Formin-like protein 5 n=1 Tax=Cyclospora cayetanensis TaxID=88456 RepID=A0A6P6S195_9EIME|nr:formin-like protein 5 [Cyclospora cayetanensis]
MVSSSPASFGFCAPLCAAASDAAAAAPTPPVTNPKGLASSDSGNAAAIPGRAATPAGCSEPANSGADTRSGPQEDLPSEASAVAQGQLAPTGVAEAAPATGAPLPPSPGSATAADTPGVGLQLLGKEPPGRSPGSEAAGGPSKAPLPGACAGTVASSTAVPKGKAPGLPPGYARAGAPPGAGKAPGPPPGAGKAPGPPPGAGKAPGPPPGAGKAPGPPPGAGKAPGLPPGRGKAPPPPGGKGPPPRGPPPPGKKGGPLAKSRLGAKATGPVYVLPEEHLPIPPEGLTAVTRLQWTLLKSEQLTGTLFDGLLDRYDSKNLGASSGSGNFEGVPLTRRSMSLDSPTSAVPCSEPPTPGGPGGSGLSVGCLSPPCIDSLGPHRQPTNPGLMRRATFHYNVDYGRVFSLFYKEVESQQEGAKKALEDGGGPGGSSGKTKKGVLDAKSSQNVEICLKKYKMTTEADFRKLASQFQDPEQLSIDTTLVQNLVQYWPEADAVEAFKAKTQEEALQMPTADKLFFFLIKDVPLCCDRLKFYLELGNCVNRGKKEALGFKLKDFVAQLSACTSKDRSTNLFKLLVETVCQQNEAVCDELRALQIVDAAKGTDVAELVNLSSIESRLSFWSKIIAQKKDQLGPAADSMHRWVQASESRLHALKEMVADNEKRQEEFRVFLGLSKHDCVWPEPLRWFGHFYSQFDQVARDLRDAKEKEAARREREMKKQQQISTPTTASRSLTGLKQVPSMRWSSEANLSASATFGGQGVTPKATQSPTPPPDCSTTKRSLGVPAAAPAPADDPKKVSSGGATSPEPPQGPPTSLPKTSSSPQLEKKEASAATQAAPRDEEVDEDASRDSNEPRQPQQQQAATMAWLLARTPGRRPSGAVSLQQQQRLNAAAGATAAADSANAAAGAAGSTGSRQGDASLLAAPPPRPAESEESGDASPRGSPGVEGRARHPLFFAPGSFSSGSSDDFSMETLRHRLSQQELVEISAGATAAGKATEEGATEDKKVPVQPSCARGTGVPIRAAEAAAGDAIGCRPERPTLRRSEALPLICSGGSEAESSSGEGDPRSCSRGQSAAFVAVGTGAAPGAAAPGKPEEGGSPVALSRGGNSRERGLGVADCRSPDAGRSLAAVESASSSTARGAEGADCGSATRGPPAPPRGALRGGGPHGKAVVKLRGRVTGGREDSSEREPTNPYIADNSWLHGGSSHLGGPRTERGGGPQGAVSPRRLLQRKGRTAASPQNDLLFARVVAQRSQQQQQQREQQYKQQQQIAPHPVQK